MPTDVSGHRVLLCAVDLVCVRHHFTHQRAGAACRHERAHRFPGHGLRHKDTYNQLSCAEWRAFTMLFNYGGILSLFLVLLGIAPSACISALSIPLIRSKERHEAEQQALLAYLHQRITQIVPSVRLPVPPTLSAVRSIVEIGDARDIILSHVHPHARDAACEAQYLASHLYHQRQITELGPFTPPPIMGDAKAYYVLVAQQLQDLEGSPHSILCATTES